eukprot:NODE_194_length_15414_cov_0.324127.p11 type:complete len:125 gc:universal NODE_194_length_15414_cov_0.324127:2528-2154(-)
MPDYTIEQVQSHTKRNDVWMAIHNKIYDVSKFLDAHPGGEEVLMDHAGQEATGSFEDIGHSDEAREMMAEYLIGNLKKSAIQGKNEDPYNRNIKVQVHESSTNYYPYIVPLVAVAAYVLFKYLQ